MTIQTRLFLSIIISFVISAVFACATFYTLWEMKAESERSRLYDEAIAKANGLNVILASLRIDSNPSDMRQIINVHNSLENLLKKMSSQDALEQSLVSSIQSYNQRLQFLLGQVVALGGEDNPALQQRRKEILDTQLWMKVGQISDEMYRLRRMARSRMSKAHTEAGVTVIFMLVALMLSNTLISVFAGKKIVKSERALRESEERYRLIVQTAMDGFWRLDMQGHLLEVNNTYCQMSGYTRQELLKMSASDLEALENPAETAAHFRKITEQGDDRFESRHRRKDGSLFDVEISVQHRPGDDSQIVVFLRDITQHKFLEEQLRQSQKMDSIGNLAGGIAHDFNNILSVIIGYAEIAQEDIPENSSVKKYLEHVLDSSFRARNLVAQLLAFSRKQALAMKNFNLNDIVKSTQAMLSRIVGEDIEMVINLAHDTAFVRADFNQMEQVLLNLVANARDAMANGGKLTIETSNIELDENYAARHLNSKRGPYVMLAVSDNGVGMDTETQSRLFEPFFTTKGKGKGTGMGLATVHGIVRQHGGSIYVYSEPGQGSTFKVYLPKASEKQDTAGVKPKAFEPVTGGETILVVEDEDAVRNLIVKVLGRLGYRMIEARSGQEALQLMRDTEQEIDLLLTDVIMPKMNGKELHQQLSREGRKLKVLYMSGYTDNVIAHHGVLDEGVEFIQKPLSSSSLAQKVRHVIELGQ